MPVNVSEIIHNRYLSFQASLLEVFVGLLMVLGTTNSVAVATLRSHYGVNALTFLVRGLPAYGWLSVHARGRLVQDGWFDDEVEMHDSAGRLLAQSCQLTQVGPNRGSPRLRRRPRIAADRRT